MRVTEFGLVGLGALLAALLIAGCTSDTGEPGYDAGTFPDEGVIGDDSDVGGDTGTLASSADGGGDSTLPSEDEGGEARDAGADALPVEVMDASDGGTHVASDASVGDASPGDSSTSTVDAGDAAVRDAEASDAATRDGASPIDAGSAPIDATTGVPDAASADAALADSASGDDDAAVGQLDAGTVALDAAPACVSCGTSLAFLGNTAAFVSGAGTSVTLQGGTVPDGATVSIITQTYPQGSVTAGSAHVVYATDSSFTTQVDAPMNFDEQTNNNDQWYAVLPAQDAGTTVYWYVRADGCNCSTVKYDNPGAFQNFSYTEQ